MTSIAQAGIALEDAVGTPLDHTTEAEEDPDLVALYSRVLKRSPLN